MQDTGEKSREYRNFPVQRSPVFTPILAFKSATSEMFTLRRTGLFLFAWQTQQTDKSYWGKLALVKTKCGGMRVGRGKRKPPSSAFSKLKSVFLKETILIKDSGCPENF